MSPFVTVFNIGASLPFLCKLFPLLCQITCYHSPLICRRQRLFSCLLWFSSMVILPENSFSSKLCICAHIFRHCSFCTYLDIALLGLCILIKQTMFSGIWMLSKDTCCAAAVAAIVAITRKSPENQGNHVKSIYSLLSTTFDLFKLFISSQPSIHTRMSHSRRFQGYLQEMQIKTWHKKWHLGFLPIPHLSQFDQRRYMLIKLSD